ncbi:energy transducer TonB [Desulfuromonas acetoxidans]|uniref:Protein TonB n=1 Tax=Desulfuromonas acetoxidans (strain DSM 684 / 11070) TaxID=281689 RepID=Q1JX32_DESA6|nr:energy transducer TonB [Desulfuromonas acetoxidans]EAT14830.1 TonB-like [Desulfuromonas acetoxidans DSM 684]MBF0646578.1 energy transducer TonB [Desulfuromonas acetoxidans]NVD26100.1 energy transducer TonB [Desulfuromonas acetoxidans]NVE17918.1 energy transducer TonB [Desulfuromonas acetoxidans]
MMQKTPRSVFIIGFVLAALINLVLFALIPHSSTPETPQPSPLRSQPVRFTPPSPQMEQPQPEEMTMPPEPAPAVPQPTLTAPTLHQPNPTLTLQAPQPVLKQVTPQPQVQHRPSVFSSEALDVLPQLSYQTAPRYPLQARKRGVSGYVKLQFDVLANGEVRRLRILESQPPGVFDNAVLNAARTWSYQPGEVLGDKVRVRLVRTIVFNLEDQP